MFGQNNENQTQDGAPVDDNMQVVNDDTARQLVSEPAADGSVATDPAAAGTDLGQLSTPGWQPNSGDPADEQALHNAISPAGGFPSAPSLNVGEDDTTEIDIPEPAIVAEPEPVVEPVAVVDDGVSQNDLLDIKQKALSELIPLIDKLDQPPEEKFRTIMMMIQASDDQRLVEKAYESAHAIEHDELRAQALLDIVNEINYFTHPESPIAPTPAV